MVLSHARQSGTLGEFKAYTEFEIRWAGRSICRPTGQSTGTLGRPNSASQSPAEPPTQLASAPPPRKSPARASARRTRARLCRTASHLCLCANCRCFFSNLLKLRCRTSFSCSRSSTLRHHISSLLEEEKVVPQLLPISVPCCSIKSVTDSTRSAAGTVRASMFSRRALSALAAANA